MKHLKTFDLLLEENDYLSEMLLIFMHYQLEKNNLFTKEKNNHIILIKKNIVR